MSVKSQFTGRRYGDPWYYKVGMILYYLFAAVCLWIAVTCMVQRFKRPSMTETQIFLNIPNSARLIFIEE
jgi:hypothetical protein